MTFLEFNEYAHEITTAYHGLCRWNEELRSQLDDCKATLLNEECDSAFWRGQCGEARKLAEYWRDWTMDKALAIPSYYWQRDDAPPTELPWEVEK